MKTMKGVLFVLVVLTPLSLSLAETTITGKVGSWSWNIAVGDINGDNFNDLVVVGPGAGEGGEVYIFFGERTHFPAQIELKSYVPDILIKGTQGERIERALITDLNADRKSDLVISSSLNRGIAYILFGPLPSGVINLKEEAAVVIIGEENRLYFGKALAAGDINGDGKEDLIIGNPLSWGKGKIYTFFGRPNFPNLLKAGSADIIIQSQFIDDEFGSALATGDVNGDGYKDLIVGAPYYQGKRGRAYLFLGPGLDSTITIEGEGHEEDYFGTTSHISDLDRDGCGDVLIGALNSTLVVGRKDRSKIFVFPGQSDLPNTLDTNHISHQIITGSPFTVLLSVGNINTDFWPDLLIGSPFQNTVGVVYGYERWPSFIDLQTTKPDVRISGDANDGLGISGDITDLDGDGLSDVVIGGFGFQGDMGNWRGVVKIIYGTSSDVNGPLQWSPSKFLLFQNYPNPFNPETEIRYQLPEAAHVTLKIYNLLGQEIRTLVDKEENSGHHTVRWDGKDEHGREMASGVYIYQIKIGFSSTSKKMILTR